jgi:hypothetical protein
VVAGQEKTSTSRTQRRRRDSINPDGEDGRIGDEVISPPMSTGRTGFLVDEPNAEVLAIEIDVDYMMLKLMFLVRRNWMLRSL